MHRIKIVGHCVPPRNAITRVMLSLGQGRGIRREGGGQTYFPLLAFQLMHHQLSSTFLLDVHKVHKLNKCSVVLMGHWVEMMHIDSNGNQIKTEMSLTLKFVRT